MKEKKKSASKKVKCAILARNDMESLAEFHAKKADVNNKDVNNKDVNNKDVNHNDFDQVEATEVEGNKPTPINRVQDF